MIREVVWNAVLRFVRRDVRSVTSKFTLGETLGVTPDVPICTTESVPEKATLEVTPGVIPPVAVNNQ
jgi:hypothetical protein